MQAKANCLGFVFFCDWSFFFCCDGYTCPQFKRVRVLHDILYKGALPALHYVSCVHSFPILRNHFKLLVESLVFSSLALLSICLYFCCLLSQFQAYLVDFPTTVKEDGLLSSASLLCSHPTFLFANPISLLSSYQPSIIVA